MYKPGDNTTLTIVRLQHCIMDIYHWMSANRLKLNMDKTELIWTGTKYSVTARNASFLSLRLGANVILPSQHVRLLGVVISADLGPEKDVSNVNATCFRHLRQLRHIRRRPSLAWRAWAHPVQTVYDDAPTPGRHCSTVSGGTLVTVPETASRQHLRSAASHQLSVPPHRRTTYGGRAFAVAGPSTWNSLPKRLRDPSSSSAVFGRLLKIPLLRAC